MLKVHLDPNNHNGAVFLGLNGLVVKSHGSANPKGIANAIGVAARWSATTSPARSATISTISAPTHSPMRRPNDPSLGHQGHRFGASHTPRRQCRVGGHRRHLRRMDRRADRNPQPLYRRRWRNHRHARARRLPARRSSMPGSSPRRSTSSSLPPRPPTRPSRRRRPRSRRCSGSTIASRSTSMRCAPASSTR